MPLVMNNVIKCMSAKTVPIAHLNDNVQKQKEIFKSIEPNLMKVKVKAALE